MKSMFVPLIPVTIIYLLLSWAIASFVAWLVPDSWSTIAYAVVWVIGIVCIIEKWYWPIRRLRIIRKAGISPDEVATFKFALANHLKGLPQPLAMTYLEDMLTFAVRVIYCDGRVDDNEIDLLMILFDNGMKRQDIVKVVQEVGSDACNDMSDPHSTLMVVLSAALGSKLTFQDFMPYIRTFELLGNIMAKSDGHYDEKEKAFVDLYIANMKEDIQKFSNSENQ